MGGRLKDLVGSTGDRDRMKSWGETRGLDLGTHGREALSTFPQFYDNTRRNGLFHGKDTWENWRDIRDACHV